MPAQEELDALAPWYQRIAFPDGNEVGLWDTGGMIEGLCGGLDFKGRTVIDVGCMSGAISLWAQRRGALYVVGIDVSERSLVQAALVKREFNLQNVIFLQQSIYDLNSAADIIIMAGVYYHLRSPLAGIERAWEQTQRVLFIEGEVNDKAGASADFYLGEYKGDTSNWWVPTRQCLVDWCRSLSGIGRLDEWGRNETRHAVRVWR